MSIKTYKKTWQVGKKWMSQIILMDETGEIPADVNVGEKYNPIRGRGVLIQVIVAEIQEAEWLGKDRKKLYIDQFSMPTQTVAEYESKQDAIIEDYEKTIRSKILCWLTAAKIEAGASTEQVWQFLDDPLTKQIVDRILEG